jgi:hypothetical protein
MVFFTQITMEAGEDGEYLDAMRKANIKGALVGVEAVTPEGLKAVFKDFNYSGEALAKQLQTFKKHGVHVLGSFIFGLPTDKAATFDATVEMALKAGVTFAQFVMMTPFPGTVDFGRWEKEHAKDPTLVGDVPITRYWLIPTEVRPKMFTPHPTMSSDEIRERTQKVWDRFYNWSAIWQRSACTPTLRPGLLLFSFRSSTGRCMREVEFRPIAPVEKSPRPGPGGRPGSVGNCSRQSQCRSFSRQHGNSRLHLPYVVLRF